MEYKRFFCGLSAAIFILLSPIVIRSQEVSVSAHLDSVVITATRLSSNLLQSPLAVTSLDVSELNPVFQNISVNEYLQSVPGLFVLNSENYAQDLRISIRGFGSRSAFGIRGVKLIVDGIPETTPDGQGQIDNLLTGSIQRMEVIRGPSSSLYGNASGGVLSITTEEVLDHSFVQGGVNVGAYGRWQLNARGGWKGKSSGILVQAAHIETDGYRAQSGMKANQFDTRYFHEIGEKGKLKVAFNLTDSPQADDPGGLTLSEVDEDRQAARGRNVQFKTGEEVTHWRLTSSYDWAGDQGLALNSYGFISGRSFYGLLPFESGGIVDLSRTYFGGGLSAERKLVGTRIVNTWMAGLDFSGQRDDRIRYNNLNGSQGDRSLDQLESFNNIGLYAVNRTEWNDWVLSIGLRYDWNRLSVDDNFQVAGDESGESKLNAFNPSFGLSKRIANQTMLFFNYSTNFETPTLSELSSNPTGATGFNNELQAQEGRNVEVGMRTQASPNFYLEGVLFHIKTDQEIIPFELQAFPDREFYRNAGETIRKGVEASAVFSVSRGWDFSATYTYADFTYNNYTVSNVALDGNKLPGIPQHMGSIQAEHRSDKGFTIFAQARMVGDLYAEDANTTLVENYTLANIKLGYTIQARNIEILPYAGINNVFGVQYFDNIRINAFGRRYYEPAPTMNIYAGFRVRFDKS